MPKAKVLNVVPAPSQGRVYPVSVSLLRVGTVSEIRLTLIRDEEDAWVVSEVLG